MRSPEKNAGESAVCGVDALEQVDLCIPAGENGPARGENRAAAGRVAAHEREVDRPLAALVAAPAVPFRHVSELERVGGDAALAKLAGAVVG